MNQLLLHFQTIKVIIINSQEIRYFYRNIVKTGDVYRVKYNNKDYGEFRKLSDALYERDALFFCNFDYDLLVECDLENKYEHMELPPFPEKRPKGRIKGTKVNKTEREGEILFDHKLRKFYIKRGDETIGSYDTMTEAFYYKKLLMDNNWDRNVLKTNITERIDVNIVIDQSKEYKVQLNFCPKCKNRLKIGAEDCPSCGINIKEYLFNN